MSWSLSTRRAPEKLANDQYGQFNHIVVSGHTKDQGLPALVITPGRYRKAYSGGIGHDLSLMIKKLGDGFESRGRRLVDPNSLTQSANEVISISHGDVWMPDDVLSTNC